MAGESPESWYSPWLPIPETQPKKIASNIHNNMTRLSTVVDSKLDKANWNRRPGRNILVDVNNPMHFKHVQDQYNVLITKYSMSSSFRALRATELEELSMEVANLSRKRDRRPKTQFRFPLPHTIELKVWSILSKDLADWFFVSSRILFPTRKRFGPDYSLNVEVGTMKICATVCEPTKWNKHRWSWDSWLCLWKCNNPLRPSFKVICS
jgi:hypothetical protein